MIENKYDIENFYNPKLGYDKISNKVKFGQLVMNNVSEKIEKVNLSILQEILEYEQAENTKKKYSLLPLSDKWLLEVFQFDSKFLKSQSMTVFSSRIHGLNIHKTRGNYAIAYTIREKLNAGQFRGTNNFKPIIHTVNELMDHLYLIKREEFNFSNEEMVYINTVIDI